MRLLSLASLGFENVGQDLPYAKIAASIHVEESEVEKWVIDGAFLHFILPLTRSHQPVPLIHPLSLIDSYLFF